MTYPAQMPQPRVDEMRVRKKADRQGYALRGSRRRDPLALDFNQWRIETRRGRVLVRGTLEQLEAWLSTPPDQRP